MATVQNVVSTAHLAKKLDLYKIAKNYAGNEAIIKYDPKRFNAMVIRLKDPKTTGLLFNSRRVVCLGAKSVTDNKSAIETFCKIIQSCGYNTKIVHLKIHNIVGSGNVNSNVNISSLAKIHWQIVQYHPELFPGAKVTFPDAHATALVFTTGKIVLTGLKTEVEMRRFYRKVVFLLDMFKI